VKLGRIGEATKVSSGLKPRQDFCHNQSPQSAEAALWASVHDPEGVPLVDAAQLVASHVEEKVLLEAVPNLFRAPILEPTAFCHG
jgi:hypothetical protein